jgi:ElaB/YqjD/DUF883 family membrane-anchored ribosome-binding protein
MDTDAESPPTDVRSEKLVADLRALVADAEKYVHENPWRAVGIAAFAGFVLGALVSRR